MLALFFFTMVLMNVAATIPTGAMAERWRWKNFCLYGLWVALPYGIYANWVWGGGWLAQMGVNWNLGHGAVDFAGSGVVHAMGGIIGLAGVMVLGPRIGKYSPEGKPLPIPAHHLPMVVVGTLILAFGWFGFTSGSAFAGASLRISAIVVNTALAGIAGAIAAMLTLQLKGLKPDTTIMCNGMLSGLVAISAPCAFVDSWAAALIGAIAGVLVVFSVFFWELHHIDDPVGAISVHGVNGLWGVISVGIFANGKYGAGWNGVVRDSVLQGIGKRPRLRRRPRHPLRRRLAIGGPTARRGRVGGLRLPHGLCLVQAQQSDHSDSRQPGDRVGRARRTGNGRHGLSRLHPG